MYGGKTKKTHKYFIITFLLIEIERKLLAPKLQIISSFFGWSVEISASKQKQKRFDVF